MIAILTTLRCLVVLELMTVFDEDALVLKCVDEQ